MNLAKRAFIASLYRDLKRSCQEISYRDLVREGLANRALIRDLVQRSCQETSFGDLVRRPGEESKGLARRSLLHSLNKDLTLRSLTQIDLLWRSPIDIYRHLVQRFVTG